MADEFDGQTLNKEPDQQSQKDALQKNELPDGVEVEMTPIEEYQQENEKAKDKLAEFGETDIEQFITKVTSNSIYARQVVRYFLGLDEGNFVNLEHKTSMQENNVTGSLVHSQYPPLVKGGPEGKVGEAATQAEGVK